MRGLSAVLAARWWRLQAAQPLRGNRAGQGRSSLPTLGHSSGVWGVHDCCSVNLDRGAKGSSGSRMGSPPYGAIKWGVIDYRLLSFLIAMALSCDKSAAGVVDRNFGFLDFWAFGFGILDFSILNFGI